MKELATQNDIKLVFSSPYHHSANGIIERQFRTIRDYINTSLKNKKNRNWADMLPEIEFSMNATEHQTLGISPAEIIYGFKIKRIN